jgi:hypothetical protein
MKSPAKLLEHCRTDPKLLRRIIDRHVERLLELIEAQNRSRAITRPTRRDPCSLHRSPFFFFNFGTPPQLPIDASCGMALPVVLAGASDCHCGTDGKKIHKKKTARRVVSAVKPPPNFPTHSHND